MKLNMFFIFFLININYYLVAQDNNVAGYVLKGDKLMRARNYTDAIEEYKNCIVLSPKNHLCWFYKARCLLSLGKEKEAIKDLYRVVKFESSYVQAYSILLKLHSKTESYDSAIYCLDKLFDYTEDKNKKIAYVKQILFLLSKTKHKDQAGKYIFKALQIDPDNLEFLYQDGKYKNTIANYKEAKIPLKRAIDSLESYNSNEGTHFYYEYIYACFQLEEYEEVNKFIRKANHGRYKSLVFRMTPEYNFHLALPYYKIYALDKAKEILSHTVKIDKSFTNAYDLLSEIENLVTDKEKVISYKKSAIDFEKEDSKKLERIIELAKTYVYIKNYKNALNTIEKCLALDKENQEALFIKGIIYHKLNRLKEGKAIFLQLISSHSSNNMYQQANFALGLLANDLKDKKLAQKSFEEAIEEGIFRYAALEEKEKINQ